MSIQDSIVAGFAAAATADRALRTLVTGTATGGLSTLTTTTKASIIAAINELQAALAAIDVTEIIDDADNAALVTTYSASKIEDRLAEIRDGILGGASQAYDTLLELQNFLTDEASGLTALLEAIGTRVSFTEVQTLTTPQKDTARTNIGAASQADLTALAARVTTAESNIEDLETLTAAHADLLADADMDYAAAFNTALNA